MATINVARKTHTGTTYEGAPAVVHTGEQELRRAVLSCLLWEDNFYESGESIANRIKKLSDEVDPAVVAELSVKARSEYKLRHAPLWLVQGLIKQGGKATGDAIRDTIQRPDELGEFLAMYWKDGRCPLTKQVKRGLREAFERFDVYQLAKYKGENKAITLRDVMFLVHPNPPTKAHETAYKSLAAGTLKQTGTWEDKLSAGADKKQTFSELLEAGKLGHMALLRNLRNCMDSGVDRKLITRRLAEGAAHKNNRALPFRYLAAMRACPQLAVELDKAMGAAITNLGTLPGKTTLVVDVSGSMHWGHLSGKSEMTLMDAAAALAIFIRGIAEECRVLTFSDSLVEVPAHYGTALGDAITNSQGHGGTQLGSAVRESIKKAPGDRMIVITDEQSHDRVGTGSFDRNYMVDVASHQNGVAYGNWIKVNGFSEAIVKWIQELEVSRLG